MIFRYFLTAVCTVMLAACTAQDQPELRVVNVSDGDTLTVKNRQNETQRIRLAYIDAPENAQAFGAKSKRKLVELCGRAKDAQVRQVDKDRYGRVVGIVHCDGVDANAEMVKSGLAWVYSRYAPKGSPLFHYEAQAKKAKLGLWQEPAPMPPWEYRRKHRR